MLTRITLLAWAAIYAGCGHKPEQPGGDSSKWSCVPGTVYSCVRGSCTGHQTCIADGSSMTACLCNGIDAAGSGGSTSAKDEDAGPAPAPMSKPDAGPKPMSGAAGKPSSPADPAPTPDAGRARDAGAVQTPERCDNGAQCFDAAPSGWQGPVAFRTGADPITCTGMFDQSAFEAGDAADAPPAQCASCTCSGGCSSFVDFGTSDGAQCGGTSCSTSVSASCIEISPQCLEKATTASLKTALSTAAACTPSEQHASVPVARWKTHVVACKASDTHRADCSTEQQCLPSNPGPGFEAAYCIWREGEQECPVAAFMHRRVYYRELSDTRSCSACACAAPSCSYTWRVYNLEDANCASPVLELSSAGQCAQINPVMGKLRVGAAVANTGACSASGGESLGGASGAKPVTICCGS